MLSKAHGQVELVLQRGLENEVNAASISPNDRYLALASDKHSESTILVYDLKQGMILRRLIDLQKRLMTCNFVAMTSCSHALMMDP